MTSPRRRQGKPIESVALKITFRADRKLAAKIREAIPSAVVRNGICEIRIRGERPEAVADETKVLLEKIRKVV